MDLGGILDETAFRTLSNPTTNGLLFPNVRHLYCEYRPAGHALHLPFPSLVSLDAIILDPGRVEAEISLRLLPELSPNLRNITFGTYCSYGFVPVAFSKVVSNCICRWQNIQTVFCLPIALDLDTLVHLSRMPALTQLDFALDTPLPHSDSLLLFSNVHYFVLRSKRWTPVSRLLPQIRLPAITNFGVFVHSCPSRREFLSFLTSVQTHIPARSLGILWITQEFSSPPDVGRSDAPLLGLDDLRPCMAFHNLHRIKVKINWKVGLTDSDLLTLASALPHLYCLLLNPDFGWKTPGGITPSGLLRFLQLCRSLNEVSVAIDTRGYTEMPPSGTLANLTSTRPYSFYIDVLDSTIEAECVPVIASFFACIEPRSGFRCSAWNGKEMAKPPGWEVYKDRWGDVSRRVTGAANHS